MYSVLILTKNEEINIGGCIESLLSDDIHVLDSYSSDLTCEIAASYSVNVVYREFDNYAAQRNFGLSLNFKYPWVFVLDADERMNVSLHQELISTISNDTGEVDLYRIRRKDIFWGRWLKKSSGYPTWLAGLIRVGKVSVKRDINEEYHAVGKESFLNNHTFHYPFSKGIGNWIDRHNRYSDMEARLLLHGKQKGNIFYVFNRNPSIRRRELKRVAYLMPGRPLLTFIYLYFVRGGIFDGYPGFVFCLLRTYYEFIINVKVKFELNNCEKDENIF